MSPAQRAAGASPQGIGVAAVWMLGAIASFSTMAIAGREIGGEASSFEIMFWRSFLALPALTALVLLWAPGAAQLRTDKPALHSLRNVVHFFGQNCWFYAITLIPLAQVMAIEFTSPVWVALLAPLLLGEHLTRTRLVAVVCGVIGVLLVTRPGFAALEFGQLIALGAAVGFALTNLTTKRLTRTETTLCIVFWMTASQTAMAIVAIALTTGGAPPLPDARVFFWLCVIAVVGLTAHYTLTSAYAAADASVVSPMEFARLPIIAVVAAALYAEALDPFVLFGGLAIFAGNLYNLRAERRRRADP